MKIGNLLMSRLRRFYRSQLYVPINALRGKEPLIIYTVGKVGSTSIYESLPEGVFWVQVHTLNPQEWEQARASLIEQDELPQVLVHAAQVRRYILEAGRKAKYITVVREPLAAISRHSSKIPPYDSRRPSSNPEDQAEQAKLFLEHYPHDRILNFFDSEYKTMLGVDVFAEPFPHEQGYQRLSFERGELLILRTETDDKLKEKAVAEYLNLPDFRLKRSNVRDEQPAASAYRVFKQSLVLPESYIERMLDSQYCRHFYTPQEIQALREQWLARL